MSDSQTSKPSTHSSTCTAFGCPCYGALQSSTTGGTDWYCLFHFGRQPSELQAITQVLRENSDVVDAMYRARVADDFEWVNQRAQAAWLYMDRIGKPELQPGTFETTRKVWDRRSNQFIDEPHRIDETRSPRAWANRLQGYIEAEINRRVVADQASRRAEAERNRQTKLKSVYGDGVMTAAEAVSAMHLEEAA